MNVGGFISDIFDLLQANMIVSLVILVIIAAMAIYRPKNFFKLTCIGLGIAFCIYMATYLFGLTSSGVDYKERVTDEEKYEQQQPQTTKKEQFN